MLHFGSIRDNSEIYGHILFYRGRNGLIECTKTAQISDEMGGQYRGETIRRLGTRNHRRDLTGQINVAVH